MNIILRYRLPCIVLLLLLLTGCTEIEKQDVKERVPSPTSALLEEQHDPVEAAEFAYDEIKLRFNEIRSSGKLLGAYPGCESADWFELYNYGTKSVELWHLSITNDPEKTDKYRLPEVSVQPGEYIAICCCSNDNHPSVPMGISRRGETLYVFGGSRRICEVSVPPLDDDVSWGFDGQEWGYCTILTPGAENARVFPSLDPVQSDFIGLTVSELMIEGSSAPVTPDGGYSDFVEFYNDSNFKISLNNWYLSDNENDLRKWPFPDVSINAGEYLLVLLGGDSQIRDDGLLQADFSLNKRECLYLFDWNSLTYYVFRLPETIRPDVSIGTNGEYFFVPTPGKENAAFSYTADTAGCFDAQGVFISEVCAYAGAGNNDWIEIYNASSDSVSVSGWQIRKDKNGEKAIDLNGTISSGCYAVFETTSHIERQKEGVGTFGLSMSGETLYLVDEKGILRDEFTTGVLEPGISSGRIENNPDIARVFFSSSTKGTKNSDNYSFGYAKAPVFSETGLYQSEPFELSLVSDDDAKIHYTTNGSEPDLSSKVYTGPIKISKNTVVRALAQKDGLITSEIVTYTFLFEKPHELPVVCVSLKPEDKDALSSAKSKVSSSKAQRKGHFSYYEGGKLATDFPADFKTKGAGTLGYNQISLTIHLRGKYGKSSVTYPFFDEYGWREYTSLCIRNSGQDISQARIRDSYASRLCFGLNIDVVATRPVAVYINGKYYGLYDLNEDQNDDFLESHYGIDKSQVEIIRYNERVVKGSNSDWRKVINYAKTKSFADDSVYEAFTKWVDTDYFIDYLVCSTYLCNSDMANQKYWHTKDNTIRWRAIFYDFDFAFGLNEGSVKRSILKNFFSKTGTKTATSTLYTYIPAALVHNKGWRDRFIERYVELIVTAFAPERAVRILNELKDEMSSEMPRHIARWGRPSSYSKWEKNIDYIRKWVENRPAYALENLRKYFSLDKSYINQLVAKYTPVA